MVNNRTTCPTCRFTLKNPILQLPATNWGFYNDRRFPGRTILALKPHREQLTTLPNHLMSLMFADIRTVMLTMQQTLKTNRIELVFPKPAPMKPYHLHAHLIPYPATDDATGVPLNPATPPKISQLFNETQTQAHISALLSHYHKNNPEITHQVHRTVTYSCRLCDYQVTKPEHEEHLAQTLIAEHNQSRHPY